MDTLVPVPVDQVRAFRAELEPVVLAVCPRYGLDPRRCMAQAIEVSGYGRFALSYNYWNLQGRGSRGFFWAVVAPLDGGQAHGGVAPMRQQRAKFSSPAEAVDAWCRAQGGRRA